ncbi:hypothetical protein N7492_003879 [Penicillium capsulatum]|uniref:Beta-glucuronidase C-terminal domain-containing protein n=1 Tax=Penicillium capsulatum TaxID=69766 RepID=A0A9W9LXD0_9EURO|nr:hypothetical protein N7492_003879 [Penicillium capsulatum]KAJ6121540.1 hypothetical protein N7512_004005 [Penicillium capsulatum]
MPALVILRLDYAKSLHLLGASSIMVPLFLLPALFSAAALAETKGKVTPYQITVDENAHDNAPVVPANFFGFGFESAFLADFGQNFSSNLVQSIGDRMKEKIVIRIGGTSGDKVQVDLTKNIKAKPLHGENPHSHKTTFVLGSQYFDAFKYFPDALFTIQAPIFPHKSKEVNGKSWLERSADYIGPAVKQLQGNGKGEGRLLAIALGNEPNFYDYDLKEYLTRAKQVEDAIVKALGLKGNDARIFQVGEIPNEQIETGRRIKHDYGLQKVVAQDHNPKYMRYAAQHYYQVSAKKGEKLDLQTTLMNHNAVKKSFGPIDGTIRKMKSDVDYVISEAGSSIGTPDVAYSSGFGTALWAIDFHLYAMTRGVKRISNTMRAEAAHAFWVPIDTSTKDKPSVIPDAITSAIPGATPSPGAGGSSDSSNSASENDPIAKNKVGVRGIFAAAPFITDFVGASGKVQELNIPQSPATFSAYALYDEGAAGHLKRVALINLAEWNPDMPRDRGTAKVTLNFKDAFKGSNQVGIQPATYKLLECENGAAGRGYDFNHDPRDNTTWGGQQWTKTLDDGVGHFRRDNKEERHDLTIEDDGTATVELKDSEAMIVFFQ